MTMQRVVFICVGLLSVLAAADNVVEEDTGELDVYATLLARVEALEAADLSATEQINRLDMLIKFYNPEWTWTVARECGKDCPYLLNLLDFAAVQWRTQPGDLDGIFDLEFVNELGRIHGNMDFYDRQMYVWNCGWITYLEEAPASGDARTWTFVKTDGGFQFYCDTTLLVDYTYTEGRCADLWAGPTIGFYFETTPQAVHLLQHGMDMFWFTKAS